MSLTEKEEIVLNALRNAIDEHDNTIAYSELENIVDIPSRALRGVISSLVKKKLLISNYNKEAQISFLELI